MIGQPLAMTPMTLAQLLPAIDFPDQLGDVSICGFSIDSRQIRDAYVFVAMQGIKHHGKDFIPQAIQQGAVVVLIEGDQLSITEENGVVTVCLPDMAAQLSHIVGHFYGHPTRSINVVGITGTNGKTTCSQLYAQLCALIGTNAGVVGTNGYGVCSLKANAENETFLSLTNTGMTTPDAISSQAICADLVASGSQHIVMEVSSHGLEQGRVAAIDFDGAIFTNLSHDHLDYHGDMASYGAAKAKLFTMKSLDFVVLNRDDDFSKELLALIDPSVRVVSYSISNTQADIFLSDIHYHSNETQALLHTRLGVYTLSTQLVGKFNLSNLLAVLGAFYPACDQPDEIALFQRVIELIAYIRPVSGRLESIANALDKQVLVDYAHTPDALENVLQAIAQYAQAKVYCVFGCGGDRDKEKRVLMARVAETYADHIIVTNDNPRTEEPEKIVQDICRGFRMDKHQIILDREQAITASIRQSTNNDVVLIAGKGHEDYQLIGDVKTPFSDQAVARFALRDMEAAR